MGLRLLTPKDPRYVAGLYYDYKHTKQIRRIPRMIRREAGTENSLVKDIRILLRYQHDDKVAGSRSFSLCRSSVNQLKEALWSCVMRVLEDRSGR